MLYSLVVEEQVFSLPRRAVGPAFQGRKNGLQPQCRVKRGASAEIARAKREGKARPVLGAEPSDKSSLKTELQIRKLRRMKQVLGATCLCFAETSKSPRYVTDPLCG